MYTVTIFQMMSLYAIFHAVALNHEDFDDAGGAVRMMLAGIPLNEPHLQKRLSELANTERSILKEGKLPITESFYLMGTADPTGSLTGNKVCVILYVDFLPVLLSGFLTRYSDYLHYAF